MPTTTTTAGGPCRGALRDRSARRGLGAHGHRRGRALRPWTRTTTTMGCQTTSTTSRSTRVSKLDTDGDGIGNNMDTDDDGDGYLDAQDEFPLDASEWMDTDSDGTGDNSDADDDNDSILDESMPAHWGLPLGIKWEYDHDGDGCRDSIEDADDDNDGVDDPMDGCPRGSWDGHQVRRQTSTVTAAGIPPRTRTTTTTGGPTGRGRMRDRPARRGLGAHGHRRGRLCDPRTRTTTTMGTLTPPTTSSTQASGSTPTGTDREQRRCRRRQRRLGGLVENQCGTSPSTIARSRVTLTRMGCATPGLRR